MQWQSKWLERQRDASPRHQSRLGKTRGRQQVRTAACAAAHAAAGGCVACAGNKRQEGGGARDEERRREDGKGEGETEKEVKPHGVFFGVVDTLPSLAAQLWQHNCQCAFASTGLIHPRKRENASGEEKEDKTQQDSTLTSTAIRPFPFCKKSSPPPPHNNDAPGALGGTLLQST